MNRLIQLFSVSAVVAILLCGQVASAQTNKAPRKPASAAKPPAQLVTEGEFSKWLVQVLGLSRFVSVAPSDQECFAVLMQNGISPKNGWISSNVVTRATLARVVVQSLGQSSDVKNPENDSSWIDYLKEKGLDIGTIGAAVENLEVLGNPLANEAVSVSTDPLGKVEEIRPEGEQQLGADLSTIRRVLSFLEQPTPPKPTPTPKPPHHRRPSEDQPEPTQNFPI